MYGLSTTIIRKSQNPGSPMCISITLIKPEMWGENPHCLNICHSYLNLYWKTYNIPLDQENCTKFELKTKKVNQCSSKVHQKPKEQNKRNHCFCCMASLRAASCSSCVSTSSAGSCTYRTTDPRMKQFFTDN